MAVSSGKKKRKQTRKLMKSLSEEFSQSKTTEGAIYTQLENSEEARNIHKRASAVGRNVFITHTFVNSIKLSMIAVIAMVVINGLNAAIQYLFQ